MASRGVILNSRRSGVAVLTAAIALVAVGVWWNVSITPRLDNSAPEVYAGTLVLLFAIPATLAALVSLALTLVEHEWVAVAAEALTWVGILFLAMLGVCAALWFATT